MAAETTLQSSPQEKEAVTWGEIEKKINEINVDAVRSQEQCFEEFLKELESVKGSTRLELAQGGWKKKLESKKEEVKNMSSGGIDRSFDMAMDYISELPQEHQNAGESLFGDGHNEVMKTAQLLFQKMKDIISSVYDEEFWDMLVKVRDAVNSIMSKAIDAISANSSG